MKVSKGDIVSVEYTIRLDDDRVIETTVGESPLSYTHGQNEILQGLEAGLDGMERGAAKVITVEPVDAYGEEDAIGRGAIPASQIDSDSMSWL